MNAQKVIKTEIKDYFTPKFNTSKHDRERKSDSPQEKGTVLHGTPGARSSKSYFTDLSDTSINSIISADSS